MTTYVHAAAYSLNCHVGAMVSRRLYRTFQSLAVHRTASETSMGHKGSVAIMIYHGPESAGADCYDGRCSWHVVHQSKFSETSRVVIGTDLLTSHQNVIHTATQTHVCTWYLKIWDNTNVTTVRYVSFNIRIQSTTSQHWNKLENFAAVSCYPSS